MKQFTYNDQKSKRQRRKEIANENKSRKSSLKFTVDH